MSAHDYDKFWNSVRKCNQKKCCLPNNIDGVCGVQNIASMSGKHFQGLLNVSKDTSCREHITNICSNIPPSDDTIVTVDEVSEAINSSK